MKKWKWRRGEEKGQQKEAGKGNQGSGRWQGRNAKEETESNYGVKRMADSREQVLEQITSWAQNANPVNSPSHFPELSKKE